jgi:hypothetical protein
VEQVHAFELVGEGLDPALRLRGQPISADPRQRILTVMQVVNLLQRLHCNPKLVLHAQLLQMVLPVALHAVARGAAPGQNLILVAVEILHCADALRA